MLVIGLALDQVLEDAEHGRHLPALDDLTRPAREERPQEAHERGDVAAGLPQRGRQERGEEDRVLLREVVGRAELEELRQDLEDKGGELGDVLLQDGVEGREECGLERGECGRVGRSDEAAPRRVAISRGFPLSASRPRGGRTG